MAGFCWIPARSVCPLNCGEACSLPHGVGLQRPSSPTRPPCLTGPPASHPCSELVRHADSVQTLTQAAQSAGGDSEETLLLCTQVLWSLKCLGPPLLPACARWRAALSATKQRAACSLVANLMDCASGLLLHWQLPTDSCTLETGVRLASELARNAHVAFMLASGSIASVSADLAELLAAGPAAPGRLLRAAAAAAHWLTADYGTALDADLLGGWCQHPCGDVARGCAAKWPCW